MAFSKGNPSITLDEILYKTTELDILSYYLNIKKVPCIINSPLREDNKPSFGIYSPDKVRINFIDFATKERGTIFTLLKLLWHVSFKEVLYRIYNDMIAYYDNINNLSNSNNSYNLYKIKTTNTINIRSLHECNNTELKCKVREWRDYDIEYWSSYGISLEWLKYAEVYPISHKIIIKEGNTYVFGADKYAYAYVEHKENKVTLKIYQPLNTNGYKWCNKHNSSVVSLWTKVPKYGDKICICSSLKDALCLWSNVGIPSLSIQGEGYSISTTAIKELKRRYKHIYICLDNDAAGLKDAEKLSKETGFTNIILPKFVGGKDISDYYKIKGKKCFIKTIKSLFNQ